MADSSAVDAAIVGRLAADAQLLVLCPGGVYFAAAPRGRTMGFVLVALVAAFDEAVFAEAPALRRAIEDITYSVHAVVMESAMSQAEAAAARIDALLEDSPLTIPGFGWMSTRRAERIRYSEVDSVDSNIRWQHHGGQYRVQVTPMSEVTP